MAIKHINIGAAANDKTGTPARQAGQMINENFDYLDGKISNVNKIITPGTFVLAGQNLTIHVGWVWEINGQQFFNPEDVVINFPYAATGKQRLDRLVFNTSNTFTKVVGVESVSNPFAEPIPADTIDFGISLVTDSAVGDPSIPIIGDVYVQKNESQDYVVSYGAATVVEQINLIDNRLSVSITGSITDVKSVQLSSEFIRPGKPHYFKNRTNHNVKIWHNSGTGNIKYFFPDGVDLIVKPNQVIEFNLNSNDSVVCRLELVGCTSSEGNFDFGNFNVKFSKTYFTSLADFTATSFSPTFLDGKMRLTGGTGDFGKYITIDGLKNTDENIELEVILKVSSVNAGSYGIAIGKKSLNTWYPASIACHFSPVQSTAYIWDSDSSTQIASKEVKTVAANDIISLKYSQISNVIFFTYKNITQGYSGQIKITGNLSESKNFKIPNSSNICLWNLGGTMDIVSVKCFSFSGYSPNVICVGDSKTVGYSSKDNLLRWSSNIDGLGPVITNAGDGDRTVETIQTIDYTKLLNSKYAILCVGRNDLASGVSSSVWQSNYVNIVLKLEAQKINVVHLLPIPETALSDQSVLKNWILSTYGTTNTVDPAVGWNNGTMLSSDGVHPNATGHMFIAKKIIESGLIIPSQNTVVFSKNKQVDDFYAIPNANRYLPYSDGSQFLNSEIFRYAANLYALGTITPYDFGSGFTSFQIMGSSYGLVSVGRIGELKNYYFSGNGIKGFIGANTSGLNVNAMTINEDGDVYFEDTGSYDIDSSAKVQIESTTKGFLPPRMTNTQRIAILSPAIGLMVYCTDETEGLYVFKSTGWTFII